MFTEKRIRFKKALLAIIIMIAIGFIYEFILVKKFYLTYKIKPDLIEDYNFLINASLMKKFKYNSSISNGSDHMLEFWDKDGNNIVIWDFPSESDFKTNNINIIQKPVCFDNNFNGYNQTHNENPNMSIVWTGDTCKFSKMCITIDTSTVILDENTTENYYSLNGITSRFELSENCQDKMILFSYEEILTQCNLVVYPKGNRIIIVILSSVYKRNSKINIFEYLLI
jgi:hypothetical protein